MRSDQTQGAPSFPFRELVPFCKEGTTYRYYLDPDAVEGCWERLSQRHGPVSVDPTVCTREVRGRALLFKASQRGNPITVVRRPPCTADDVDRFHEMIGFHDDT